MTSSTFHKQATGFFCSMWTGRFKSRAGEVKGGIVEKPQILNIYTVGTGLCVYFLRHFTFDG